MPSPRWPVFFSLPSPTGAPWKGRANGRRAAASCIRFWLWVDPSSPLHKSPAKIAEFPRRRGGKMSLQVGGGSGGSGSDDKLLPNLDQNSTKVLNLTLLRRMDPFVEEILITAAHVTFYEFNTDLNKWVRCPPSPHDSLPPAGPVSRFSLVSFVIFWRWPISEAQGRRGIPVCG